MDQAPLGQLLDPTTGEVLDAQGLLGEVHQLRAENKILRDDRDNLERELRSKRSQIARLKDDQHARFRTHPRYEDACEVLAYWQEMLEPKAKEPFSMARIEPTIRRLDGGFTVEELKTCIRGYSRRPYVVDPGRRAPTGKRTERRTEPELIFRNAGKVRFGMEIAEEEAEQRELFANPEPAQRDPGLSVMGQKAVGYARYGFSVFPCRPGQKTPATRHGLLDAHRDEGRIVSYWSRVPEANVAIRTGQESGIVVLDVDGDEGADSLHELEAEHGSLPTTLRIETPRGGSHYYFKHPAFHVANTQGVPGPGLDIRGDGGYVLAPPSLVDGRSYTVDERAVPTSMPEWLVKLIAESQRQTKDSKYWIDLVQGTREGERNGRMAQIVGMMLRRGMELDLVGTMAMAVNARFHPPLPEKEVAKVVDSIYRRHTR